MTVAATATLIPVACDLLGVLGVALPTSLSISVVAMPLGKRAYRAACEQQTGYGQCGDQGQSPTSTFHHRDV